MCPCRFEVGLYGWYGRIDSRENRGELAVANGTSPIRYITYDEDLFREVSQSTRLEFLTFSVTLLERPTPTTTTEPTVAPATIPITLLVGVGVVLVVVVLVVLLIIALVCVFGRRRNQPKKKR